VYVSVVHASRTFSRVCYGYEHVKAQRGFFAIRWPEEDMRMNTVRAVPERWRAKWVTVDPDRDGRRSLDRTVGS